MSTQIVRQISCFDYGIISLQGTGLHNKTLLTERIGRRHQQYQGVIEYQYKLRVFHTTIPDVNARAFLLSQRNHCIRDVATTKNFTYNHIS